MSPERTRSKPAGGRSVRFLTESLDVLLSLNDAVSRRLSTTLKLSSRRDSQQDDPVPPANSARDSPTTLPPVEDDEDVSQKLERIGSAPNAALRTSWRERQQDTDKRVSDFGIGASRKSFDAALSFGVTPVLRTSWRERLRERRSSEDGAPPPNSKSQLDLQAFLRSLDDSQTMQLGPSKKHMVELKRQALQPRTDSDELLGCSVHPAPLGTTRRVLGPKAASQAKMAARRRSARKQPIAPHGPQLELVLMHRIDRKRGTSLKKPASTLAAKRRAQKDDALRARRGMAEGSARKPPAADSSDTMSEALVPFALETCAI